MKPFFYLLILFVFLGCEKKNIKEDSTIVNNSIRSNEFVFIEQNLTDSIIFSNFSVIPLETTDNSLIQRIDRISINNGRVYIFDDVLNKIQIFNDKGKHINQIYSIGQGPQEYNSVMDFCLDEENNEILVLCDRPYKLMRFSLDGDFINETKFPDYYKEMSIDSDYLFFSLDVKENNSELGCFDQEVQLVYKGLFSRNNINNHCYGIGKNLVKSKNLSYTRRFDSSIYHLSKDNIEKKYELDFGRHTFPKDLPSNDDCSNIFNISRENKYIYIMTNVVESDKYIMFSTNLGICLYYKETNELGGYRMIYNRILNWGSSTYYPNSGSGNSIIASFEPASLEYYKKDKTKNSPIINELIDTVKEDDNPILIVYEFKE